MNHLETKHLRMICAIADTGNMTKAAKKLFITQSALSQQLKDIESKLGASLFFRAPKKMILTSIGKKLLHAAQGVIDTLEDIELEIAQMVSGDKGEIKVGTQCMYCYKWLPVVLRLFQNKFPKVEFEIGNCMDLVADLESKKYDLIITAASINDDQFTCFPLFEDKVVCIMPEDHPLSAQAYVDLQDFSRFNFISHAEKAANKFYQFALKPIGVEPKRFMVIGQPQAILELVASGFGITPFPRWAVRSSLESKPIIERPITKGGMPMTWYAAYLQNNSVPAFHQEFIHTVKKMNIPHSDLQDRQVISL
jgi:LysR family transcriptional regulator for metE and metH